MWYAYDLAETMHAMRESDEESRVDDWNKWIHIDIKWKEHKIKDMWSNYIQNTIDYFYYLDTTCLGKELLNRSII